MTKFTILSAVLFSATLFSQETTTLQHFNSQEITPVADSYANNTGYHSGHNNYGDEEFAEKYEINGNGKIHGVMAIHAGQAGTSTMNASYKVYSVGTNGLPSSTLGVKSIANNDIPIDGSLFTVNFHSPVNVANQFFVSFNLGDYTHTSPGTKKIALTHAPNGTRPSSDSVFGRNAIRWHSHGAVTWKDYRTQNAFPNNYQPSVYFSLFPIIELEQMSVLNFDQSSIGAVYPNPSSSGIFNIPLKSSSGGEAVFQLYDLSGKLLAENKVKLSSVTKDYQFKTNQISAGTYLLLITIPDGKITQKVIIR